MIAALLPVKMFAHSKQRLAGVLRPAGRYALARAMFDDMWDTLCALRAEGAVRHLLVASAEPYVLGRCVEEQVPCLKECEQISHSESVWQATRWAQGLGVTTLLSVAIDTPGATVKELSSLLALAQDYSVVIVPSADGSGTNALLRSPADAIAPLFGPGSLRLHVQAAEVAGASSLVYRSTGLAADIDTPDDIENFLALDRQCRTASLLRELLPEDHGIPLCH